MNVLPRTVVGLCYTSICDWYADPLVFHPVVGYLEPQIFIIALDSYEKDVTLDAVDFFNDFSRHNIPVLRLRDRRERHLHWDWRVALRGVVGIGKMLPPYSLGTTYHVSSENAIAKTKVLNIFGSFLY